MIQGLLDSRRLRLVWAALLHIAADPVPVSGKTLAERLDCSRRYLEADLQTLAQSGLIESRRGARGGYRLGRSAQRITLLDVQCCLAPEGPSTESPACPLLTQVVLPQLDQARDAVSEVLAAVTLAQAMRAAVSAGLLTVSEAMADFCI